MCYSMIVYLMKCMSLLVLLLLRILKGIIVLVGVIFCITCPIHHLIFTMVITYNSAKEIWDALKKKYSKEDAGFKKYVVGRFLDFKMVDEKPIMDQVNEYQHIVLEILAKGMKIDEAFQAAALIEKLPPSWKDDRNYLKHKSRDLSMENLIVHVRIEESNWMRDKTNYPNLEFTYKANLVEQKNFRKNGKGLMERLKVYSRNKIILERKRKVLALCVKKLVMWLLIVSSGRDKITITPSLKPN